MTVYPPPIFKNTVPYPSDLHFILLLISYPLGPPPTPSDKTSTHPNFPYFFFKELWENFEH